MRGEKMFTGSSGQGQCLWARARAGLKNYAAGWRGLAAGIIENTVSKMREVGSQEILAWLGPAIGPTCFEVGEDLVSTFVEKDISTRHAFTPVGSNTGKFLANIYQLAHIKLHKLNIHRISGGTHCTMTNEEQFYSYRRDKTTGRMASLIWIKPH